MALLRSEETEMSDKITSIPECATPILYTDYVGGKQTFRDDLWALSTSELSLMHEELTRLRAQLAERDAMLADAADCIESWGAYAGEYFQKKHDLAGDIRKFREFAKIADATAQANAKIIAAAEEQERAHSIAENCASFDDEFESAEFAEACIKTVMAVREKKELNPVGRETESEGK